MGTILVPGHVWHCLETYSIITMGVCGDCFRHLVGKVQGCCPAPYNEQDSPLKYPVQKVNHAKVKKSGIVTMELTQVLTDNFWEMSEGNTAKGTKERCSGWCDSVDWVPACKPKGRQFNSQSMHMPAGQVPSRGCARGNLTCMFLSLSLSPFLPFSLTINK